MVCNRLIRFIGAFRQYAQRLLVFTIVFCLLGCGSIHQSFSNFLSYQKPSPLTIAVVGDVNGYNILHDEWDQEDPIKEVRDLLRDQDLFILNFEGVLLSKESSSETCRKFPRQSLFYSSPRIADFLHPTQFTIAALANNHILDCGDHGIKDTIRELSTRGILTMGAGENLSQACKPVVIQTKRVRLGIVNYLAMETDLISAGQVSPGAASWERCAGERQLAELKASADILVVVLHLHLEPGWKGEVSARHISMVKRVLDAGADIVISHGPHVPSGILQSNGRVALLSLGNFLFRPDYWMPENAHDSLIVKVTVSPDSLTLSLFPFKIDDYGKPRIPSPQEASKILQDISTLSNLLGTTVNITGESGYVKVKRQR
jgi:hypothetical protein